MTSVRLRAMLAARRLGVGYTDLAEEFGYAEGKAAKVAMRLASEKRGYHFTGREPWPMQSNVLRARRRDDV